MSFLPRRGGLLQRVPYPLPAKRQRVRSGIARAPQRIWLRHRKFVRSHYCVVPGCQALDIVVEETATAEMPATPDPGGR